jgi:nicotinate-nucleotide pyrophosphorylase (carboxylating)
MKDIAQTVLLALTEDIGSGDVTSEACVPADRQAVGRFIGRQTFVLAGTEVLSTMYYQLNLAKHDGDTINDGEIIAEVRASARTLLECERTALNFLQRLSGVATLARAFVEQVKGTNCKVLDTRKTTPGLRLLEKRAAAAGGVTNHRMGLYDAILIKNNHIAAAGGVRQALESARSSSTLPIEIEVRTKSELHEALEHGAKKLLLDNLTPSEAAEWVREIAGRATVEISGGVTLATVRAYAESGADFVSAGAITHSAPAVDISFRLELL